MESDKLPSDVRKRAMDAVDSLGRRVTLGDVASKAGLKLNEAQKALQAIAADTDGFLEVTFSSLARDSWSLCECMSCGLLQDLVYDLDWFQLAKNQ